MSNSSSILIVMGSLQVGHNDQINSDESQRDRRAFALAWDSSALLSELAGVLSHELLKLREDLDQPAPLGSVERDRKSPHAVQAESALLRDLEADLGDLGLLQLLVFRFQSFQLRHQVRRSLILGVGLHRHHRLLSTLSKSPGTTLSQQRSSNPSPAVGAADRPTGPSNSSD